MGSILLKSELRQEIRLLPQLLRSIEMLQMNSQELLEHLRQVTEENPVLEQEDAGAMHRGYEALRRQAVWLDGGVRRGGETCIEPGAVDRETESLAAFLCDQLERKRLDKPLLALCRYMTQLLDDDGRLEDEDIESLRKLKVPESLIVQALETVQSLDPPGVGARSLSECLSLQLRRQGTAGPVALAIVERFLPQLQRRRHAEILRCLDITRAQLQQAQAQIAALDPYPGRAFAEEERAVYLRPDVFILEMEGQLQVVLNDFYLPRLTLSPYYARLMRECEEKKTREYLREKVQQARWVLENLERRHGTLRRCAQAVLDAQRPFFEGKTAELAPMSLLHLSKTLALHPSTVSRAVREKYLQCRQGTYPLRFFFNRSVGGQGPSRQAVKQKLAQLVREEDPHRPLSDRRLCDLLAGAGVQVARRTVAKYRMELGIDTGAARRR